LKVCDADRPIVALVGARDVLLASDISTLFPRSVVHHKHDFGTAQINILGITFHRASIWGWMHRLLWSAGHPQDRFRNKALDCVPTQPVLCGTSKEFNPEK